MPKSKDAFRTISEVAEWLETPAHVLRFWESKFTQVKPVKRAGGRRYYRPADMLLLGGIKKLLHDDGLTIKGAQKLLREHGVKHVADLSQALDEDLIEEGQVEEAAYELDAQPEPAIEEPAKVLSFPNRSDPKQDAADTSDPVVAKPEPEAASTAPEAPKQEDVNQSAAAQGTAVEDAPTTATEPNAAQNSTKEDALNPVLSSDSPAFGSDALPAFLRRSPTPSAASEVLAEPAKDVASADTETPRPVVTSDPQKLTIDPTVRFEPVDTVESDAAQESARAAEITTPTPVTPATATATEARPMFAHRTEPQIERDPSAATTQTQDAAEQSVEPPSETPALEPRVDATPDTAPARVHVDVPAIAKIAPELDSFDARSGVLAALPGARKIAPEIANQLSEQLAELRALRDRMQSH
jgi:DNA-binding transcriptional MerR regulator